MWADSFQSYLPIFLFQSAIIQGMEYIPFISVVISVGALIVSLVMLNTTRMKMHDENRDQIRSLENTVATITPDIAYIRAQTEGMQQDLHNTITRLTRYETATRMLNKKIKKLEGVDSNQIDVLLEQG
jgi:peptidoglycan hydrolase CwlO-like protein